MMEHKKSTAGFRQRRGKTLPRKKVLARPFIIVFAPNDPRPRKLTKQNGGIRINRMPPFKNFFRFA
jgi:hypothetical protein